MTNLRRPTRAVADWDLRTMDRVAGHHSPIGDAVLPRLTRWADHSVLWMTLALALAESKRRRLRRAAGRGVGSVAVASLVANQIGKRLAPRDRPAPASTPARRIARRVPTSSSFPSGHSASAAAFALGVALEVPELAVPVGVLAAAVGYSRVYTGVHYPSDVLAGFAVGAASAGAVARLVPLASIRSLSPDPLPAVDQPPRPTGAGLVAIINPRSGSGTGADVIDRLRRDLPDAEIIELGSDADLTTELRRAAGDAEVIGVGGGDGSINAGAQVAMELNRPLLVIPAGTLNHFAGDLGLAGPGDSITALREGSAVRISVGAVSSSATDGGGPRQHYFLNTASIGAYPAFVEVRERWERRFGKPVAALIAARTVLGHYQPLEIEVDGTPRRVGLAFIGSNGYEPRGFAPGWRPDLAEGRLDVRLLDLSGRCPRSRFALALLFGRVRQSRQYVELHPSHLELRLPSPDRLSFDGEVVDVSGSMGLSMRADALTVFRPARVQR